MPGIKGVDYIDEDGNRVLTGGQKTRYTNLKNNPNFYRDIGKLSNAGWEKNGRKPRGFAANPELAKTAGKLGGTISRRRKNVRRAN